MTDKANGISVLLASQNAVRTVDLSVRSFLSFADEIICVDNGSTDGTVAILERLADDHPTVTFVNAPHVRHLYENRQLAYERSRFRWVFRGDTDFICWTSGNRDIRHIRDLVMHYPQKARPVGFEFVGNYVVGDWRHTLPGRQVAKLGRRIYQDVPGMRFCRIGRHEAVQLPGRTDGQGWDRIRLPDIHIMHADVRPPLVRFLRAHRQMWREQGFFAKYPTVEAYVREKYGEELGEVARRWAEHRDRELVPYTDEYPELVERMLQAETK